MGNKSHDESLSNERSNAQIYQEHTRKPNAIDFSGFSRSASSNFTSSGLPKQVEEIDGELIGRVQLAKGSRGYEYTNLYIGPRRARATDLKMSDSDSHAFEVFSWAAPIADLFYLGHYLSPAQDLELTAGIVRTLVNGSGTVSDYADDYLAEPVEPVFPAASMQIKMPPTLEKAGPASRAEVPSNVTEQPFVAPQEVVADQAGIRAERILKNEMKKPRKEQLSSLLQTLQARQYELITQPGGQNLVIQGSPGTGKTVVAAHRVAYLINPDSGQRGLAQGRIILVGPTKAYSDHVRKVLIDLGADPARYSIFSIEELFTGLLASTAVRSFRPNQKPDLAQSFSKDLYEVAGIAAFRFEEHYRAQYKESLLRQGKKLPAMPKLEELSAGKKLESCYDYFREGDRAKEILTEVFYNTLIADDATAEEIEESIGRRLDTWGEWLRSLSPYEELSGKSDSQWFIASLAWHLDEKINPAFVGVEHIVVDEAQDLYPIEWEFLKAANLGDRWSLVGDFNQLSTRHGHSTWKALTRQLSFSSEVQKLELGFRSTTAIMSLADSIIGVDRTGFTSLQDTSDFPKSIKVQRKNIWTFAQDQVDALNSAYQGGLLAVIVPPSMLDEANDAFSERGWRQQGDSFRWLHPARSWTHDSTLTIATPVDLRGLEYDAVVLVEPSEFGKSSRELYMGITRANRELRLLHSQGLPPSIFKWVRSA